MHLRRRSTSGPARHPGLPRRALWLGALLATPILPYGGQAAIEGVMMKGTANAALAVRRRDGSIEVIDRGAKPRFPRLAALPFVRGLFILADMLSLGMWALSESARRFELDHPSSGEVPKPDEHRAAAKAGATPTFAEQLMMVLSLILALVIFKIVPAAAVTGIFALLGWGPLHQIAAPTFSQQLLANAIEGAIKLGIFVAYIWGVGRLADVRRVFEYHGAEHIVINAYEHDPDDQQLAFIQSHGVAHPRCGTSFIVILVLLSVLLFAVLDWALLAAGVPARNSLPVWWVRWPLRIVGLIPLAGISYEIIKAGFRYYGNPLLRPLLRFGMLFQALTTRRPSNEQVQVSLAALNRARRLTEGIAEPPVPCSSVAVAS